MVSMLAGAVVGALLVLNVNSAAGLALAAVGAIVSVLLIRSEPWDR